MASLDDLNRARQEFVSSALGQRTRRAWSMGTTSVMTYKQRKYLEALLNRLDSESNVGLVPSMDVAALYDDFNRIKSVHEASKLIDRCRKLLGET